METISGKDLQQFFHQWLELPGQPEINLDWKYSNGNLSLTIEQLQTEKFVFPVEIGIRTKEGLLIKSINMASGRSNFNLPLEEKPLSVSLDPNTRLLFKPVR